MCDVRKFVVGLSVGPKAFSSLGYFDRHEIIGCLMLQSWLNCSLEASVSSWFSFSVHCLFFSCQFSLQAKLIAYLSELVLITDWCWILRLHSREPFVIVLFYRLYYAAIQISCSASLARPFVCLSVTYGLLTQKLNHLQK